MQQFLDDFDRGVPLFLRGILALCALPFLPLMLIAWAIGRIARAVEENKEQEPYYVSALHCPCNAPSEEKEADDCFGPVTITNAARDMPMPGKKRR